MKRFKLLSTLIIGLIGLVSFGYCSVIIGASNKTAGAGATISLNKGECLFLNNSNCRNNSLFTIDGVTGTLAGQSDYTLYCFYNNGTYKNSYTNSCTARVYNMDNYEGGNCPTCEEQYTSQECQQEYSLMPISSCNSEYCGLNGLCPEYTGSTMSELYINGINHLGAPIINISFPLEQAWDYNYTGDVMNINLSGENNVDYEYMDNIIRTQNSKPNTTDLNNIVSVLLPKFVPGLVILLFILFVFRFIKKIF